MLVDYINALYKYLKPPYPIKFDCSSMTEKFLHYFRILEITLQLEIDRP